MDDTDTLIAFLRARLDEDEAAANAAAETFGGAARWGADHTTDPDYGTEHFLHIGDRTIPAGLPGDRDEPLRADEVAHIARHDPERVLAEVEAKRRTMECHESWVAANGETICGRCGREHVDGRPGGHFPCQTLRLLALPYAEHPDYRTEWTP